MRGPSSPTLPVKPAHAGVTGGTPAQPPQLAEPADGRAPDVARAYSWQRVPLALTRVGAIAHGTACVRRIAQRLTRAGKPYCDIDVGHREGATTLRVWSDALPAWAGVREGSAVDLTLECRAGWRAGTLEWCATDVRPLDDAHPVRGDLLPACPVPAHELNARFDALVARLSPPAEALLYTVLDHVGLERFHAAPAAERMHHAFTPYGLLWHSIEVAEGALALASVTPDLEPPLATDLLVLGGLLHDIGKIREYEVIAGTGIRRALDGWARYHTTTGPEIIGVACALHAQRLRDAGVPAAMVTHLQHVCESHHGDHKEWGSPTPPRSREAWLVHAADIASARVRQLTDDAQAAGEPDADGWCVSRDGRRAPVLCAPRQTPADPSDARRALDALAHGEGAALVILPDESA